MSLAEEMAHARSASKAQDWAEAVVRWQSILDTYGTAVPPVVYARLGRAHRALRDLASAEAVIEMGRLRLSGLALAIEHAELAMAHENWAEAVRRWLLLLDEYGSEVPEGAQRRLSLARERLAESDPQLAEAMMQPAEAPEEGLVGFCPSCHTEVAGFGRGPNGRPNARCPSCGALERHRFLAILLRTFAPEMSAARWVFEVAPTPAVSRLLRESAAAGTYISMDLDPAADGRAVNVVGDLCNAPFGDEVFDAAVCFHVFEHIPDDHAAMAELRRVLSPSGLAFVQVPWKRTSPTDEDPTASPDERRRRFGQVDHVRQYGVDFEARMRTAGLLTYRIDLSEFATDDIQNRMALRGTVWIVARSDGHYQQVSEDDMKHLLRTRLAKTLSN